MTSFEGNDKSTKTIPEDSRSELVQNMEVLRRLPLFEDIPFEIIKLYAYIAQRRHYKENDIIFEPGNRANKAHLVIAGKVQLYAEHGGQRIDLQSLSHMGFFGYMALLAPYEWPLGAIALEDTTLLTLDRQGFRKILTRFPEKNIMVVEKLVQMRMNRMRKHMALLMSKIKGDGQVIDLIKGDL